MDDESIDDIEQLIARILKYKVGFYERFDDALPGEMEGFLLNIVLFGMTGSGKSALINNIFKSLGLSQPAVTQTTGKEGTKILESCDLSGSVTFYDTCGFGFGLDKTEEGELFRILYGIERPGDDLTRDHASAQKAAAAGVGAHRLERPPIADQMHVVVWVIKANDIRFEQGKYREIINFVQHQLKRETITIITVMTFDDELQNMPNPDEERKKLEKAAIEVTGSAKRNIFFISNSVTDQEDLASVYKERVLQLVEQALKCGELSIKIRQNQRESLKKMVHYSRSESEPGGRPLRVPVENTEPPAYPKSLP